MPTPLSVDLRQRVVSAVAAGATCRQAAERFGGEPRQRQPLVAAEAARGSRRSQALRRRPALPAHRGSCRTHPADLRGPSADLPARVARRAPGGRGYGQHQQSLALFGPSSHQPQKGAMHAAEQEREDVRAAREAWFADQLALDPNRLVFLDETAATTSMARRYGWAPCGERCRVA